MNVSVIIPVYNAAKFVGEAVASIVHQDHVAEVLLVEDGSNDESLSVCRELEKTNPKVALFRHPSGENLGASATRNLGVQRSKAEVIAFLDADDIALPNRFELPLKMLRENLSIDGVYEAVGTMFEDSSSKERWDALGFREHLTTVTKVLPPNELFYHLVLWTAGHFHLNGLVVSKGLFFKAGGFNHSLRLHQDTDFCIKASAVGNLVPGRLKDPVAVRRVHASNRYMQQREDALQSRLLEWRELDRWAKETRQKRSRRLIVRYRLVRCLRETYHLEKKNHPSAIFYAAVSRLMRLEISARRRLFGVASF
jgi:glycosyltransferase involved in cell wall biosynthesis